MAFTRSGEEGFLKKLTELTEANLANEQFGVSELAREMGMDRSNLHRKVKSITKTSVSQIIRQARLKRAMELYNPVHQNHLSRKVLSHQFQIQWLCDKRLILSVLLCLSFRWISWSTHDRYAMLTWPVFSGSNNMGT